MNKILLAAVAAFALSLASCQQASQPGTTGSVQPLSQGQGSIQNDIPYDFTLVNSCTGETIELSGTQHMVMDQSGSNAHINTTNLVGTGSDGNTYHGTINVNQVSNVNNNNSGSTYTLNENAVLSTTGGNQIKVSFQTHVTVDANGNATSNVDNISASCIGIP